MPDIITHLIISLACSFPLLLSIKEFKNKIIFLLLVFLFSILPDFDIFFNSHRSLTHSIFFIFSLFLIFSVINLKIRNQKILILPIIMLLHIVLDLFNGNVRFLYPFSNEEITLEKYFTYNFPFLNVKTDLNIEVIITSIFFIFCFTVSKKYNRNSKQSISYY